MSVFKISDILNKISMGMANSLTMHFKAEQQHKILILNAYKIISPNQISVENIGVGPKKVMM